MKLDWDAGHGPVTGPINAAAGTLAVAWAGNAAHMPPSWALIAAGTGWAGSHIAGRRKHLTGATLTLRAAGWLGAGGWCSWAIAHSPWTQWGIGSLLAGAIGLGAAMVGAHHAEERAVEEKAAAAAAEHRAALAGRRKEIATEWEQRIARVCHAAVQIVNVEDWPAQNGKPSAGVTLDGECGPGGLKWKDIAGHADALASDAKLPEGCGVEIGPGVHRGAFLIHISTTNALIDDAPYPTDYSPLSLNDPSPHGVYRDGSIAAPVVRQRSGITSGRRGSGKTNLMNVKLANQTRMADNLSWVIDLNGGGLALPWLHAWHNAGRPGRPPIDWVADTPEKALKMAHALLRIAKARKPGYKHLELQANDDKLPVSPAVPGITLNNDEVAELFSPRARRDPILRELGDIIVQIQEIARAVACNVENAALRATQDVVSEPQVVKQSALKIGMKADEQEMAYLFGWADKASPDDAPYPGCGFMKIDDEPARPFKVYRILPSQIADIVTATADRHPELDELSRLAAGDDYTTRWEGCDHLFGTGPAPATVTTPSVPSRGEHASGPVPERPRGSGVTANWGTSRTPVNDDVQAALDAADAARDKLRAAANEAVNRDPDLDRAFRDIVDSSLAWKPPTAPASDTPIDLTKNKKEDARKPIVIDIVTKASPAGIGPEAIRDAISRLHPNVEPPHAATIGRWLDADPRIHKPAYGRYAIHPDHA